MPWSRPGGSWMKKPKRNAANATMRTIASPIGARLADFIDGSAPIGIRGARAFARFLLERQLAPGFVVAPASFFEIFHRGGDRAAFIVERTADDAHALDQLERRARAVLGLERERDVLAVATQCLDQPGHHIGGAAADAGRGE